jgi:hypothetical protein
VIAAEAASQVRAGLPAVVRSKAIRDLDPS